MTIQDIYEVVSNATNEELLNVVESKSELIKNLKLIEKNDFNQYLLANYTKLSIDHKKQILECTFSLIKENYYNNSLFLVIDRNNRLVNPKMIRKSDGNWDFSNKYSDISNTEINKYKYLRWNMILTMKKFDISQKLYFLENFGILDQGSITELSDDIDLSDDIYKQMNRKDYYIIYYLRKKKYYQDYETWPKNVWEKIDEMSNLEWLTFWCYMGELQEVNSQNSIKSYSNAKKYVFARRNPKKEGNQPDILKENIMKRKGDLKKVGYTLEM